MTSIADELRSRHRAAILRMTPAERVELALRLGDQDLESYRRAHGLTRAEARRLLRARQQLGRTPCSFLEPDP